MLFSGKNAAEKHFSINNLTPLILTIMLKICHMYIQGLGQATSEPLK